MNRNRVPRELFRKLLKKSPERTIYWRIQKKLNDLNGAVSRRVAALLVAKDLKINFTRYIDDEDREELRRIATSASIEPPTIYRTIEKPVTKEIRSLRNLSSFEPFVPPDLLKEASEMAEKVYPLLYVFENSIRNVIRILMERAYGPDWWDERVKKRHKTMDDDVERRMKEEKQNNWHSSSRGVHEIYYTDIDDLRIIIQDDWKNVFRVIHERLTWVTEHIMQLSYSRNIVAHNNPLKKKDIRSIETKIFEWFDQIRGLQI